MLWFKIVGRILSTLKDGATPGQIAGGLLLGFAFGLIPGWPPQVWLVLALVLIVRVNLSMAIVGALVAAALGWLLDPLLDGLGALVLSLGPLRGLFTTLFNAPPWALTRFNNTVMMGSMIAAVAIGAGGYPLLVKGVRIYRERLLMRIQKLRMVQLLMGSRLYGFYRKLQELGLV
jgi:uncharacterized protein (TIGR03546 family)